MSMSLKRKLIIAFACLSTIPVGIVGSYCLIKFNVFSSKTISDSYQSARTQAEELLSTGGEADSLKLLSIVSKVKDSTEKLASSSSLITYITSESGNNKLVRESSEKELTRIADGYQLAAEMCPVSDRAELAKHIISQKIGETGYPFILDRKGDFLFHPNSSLIGTNLVKDQNLRELSGILSDNKSGKAQTITYAYEGRMSI